MLPACGQQPSAVASSDVVSHLQGMVSRLHGKDRVDRFGLARGGRVHSYPAEARLHGACNTRNGHEVEYDCASQSVQKAGKACFPTGGALLFCPAAMHVPERDAHVTQRPMSRAIHANPRAQISQNHALRAWHRQACATSIVAGASAFPVADIDDSPSRFLAGAWCPTRDQINVHKLDVWSVYADACRLGRRGGDAAVRDCRDNR
jgi:hypothetical protein